MPTVKALSTTLPSLLLLIAHGTTLVLLLLLSYRLASNVRFLRWIRRQATAQSQAQPRVSILVPARNEAATITACVLSLLHQTYPDYEVIVLDDASSDSTGAQLDALATAHPRLRVIHAQETPPADWNGKGYACHRLAQHATGEWLLFTDADTVHTPQSIALGVAQAETLKTDLLSAFPWQQTETWSERIMVSFIVDFLPLVGLDFRAISNNQGTHSAGNGQYLLTRATAYQHVGGHAAVFRETLDDFALAKRYRQEGFKIALVDGKDLLRCRMYPNVRALWEGFSRSMMHGLDNSSMTPHTLAWSLLFVWCYGCLFVNPFSFAVLGSWRWLALFEIAWLGILRGVANQHLRRSLLEVFTTPLAAWGVMALGIAAIYRRWQGQKVNWKGRYYMG